MPTKKEQIKSTTRKTKPRKKATPAAGKKIPAGAAKLQKDKKSKLPLPIVGIGASAGGLEAFATFFEAMPEDSGMAFVLVAHLDPGHVSILPEILQKKDHYSCLSGYRQHESQTQ